MDACKRECAANLVSGEKEPYIRTCHAAGSEIRVPVVYHGQRVLLGFIGPFALSGHEIPDLRCVDDAELQHLRQMARIFQGFLADCHRRLEAFHLAAGDRHRPGIEAFLHHRIAHNPSLTDLGDYLGLSPNRVRHLVKERTGKTFSELKDQVRLSVIQHLLTQTACSMAEIASQTGFPDPNYFCRYFKLKSGVTPTAYRTQSTTEHDLA